MYLTPLQGNSLEGLINWKSTSS